MGCCHVLKNNHEVFKDIIWYSERWDKRLGFVFLIQNTFMSQLGAIVEPDRIELFSRKFELFRKIFDNVSHLVVLILKVGETLRVVDSRLTPQLPKNTLFLCIESFVKDLNDEVNVRRLKNVSWASSEIWQLISTAVLVFAVLEENDLAVHPVSRQNFVFTQSQLKYFCCELFEPIELLTLRKEETEAVSMQFEQRRKELALMVLEVALKLPENSSFDPSGMESSLEALVRRVESSEALEASLEVFVQKTLWRNASQLTSFRQLRLQILSYQTPL